MVGLVCLVDPRVHAFREQEDDRAAHPIYFLFTNVGAVHSTTSLRHTYWWWMVRSKRSMGAWRSHKWGCCNGLRDVSLTC